MINLISQQEKENITRSFYYRLIVLFLIMLNAITLITFFVILPSYFISNTKDNVVKKKLETQMNEPVPVPDQQTLTVIKDLNNKIALIDKAEKNKFDLSVNVINAIILKKTPNVKITEINYQNDPQKGKKISITGTAPSREVLLSFRRALETNTTFKSVDLPISNFVKGADIQFYLNLILP